MWLMLQQGKPDDYVVATGVTTSVREFIIKSFGRLGVQIQFHGNGIDEVGVVSGVSGDWKIKSGDIVVRIDPMYYRPTEVELLIGDASKARNQLRWELNYDLDSLIADMVDSDLELFKRDHYLQAGGHKTFQYHE